MQYRASKLEEVADIVDSLHKTPSYANSGHPMVRVTDVKYGFLDLSNTLRVDDQTYLEFSRRYKPAKSDIIVTRVGTYGIFSKVKDTHFCLGQNTAAIVPKSINAEYLYAALNSAFVRKQIEASVVGSTQKTLSLKLIGKLEIPRLEEKYELEIADFSSCLDNRIALLRDTSSTLEAIAKVLFKSWFVDFDPVRAKQQGKKPEGMDEATAALFPESFEQSELGEIPKGWKVKKFEEFIQRLPVGKKFDQKTASAKGLIPILDQGKSGIIGYHNEVAGVNATLDKPVVVFANHTCYMRLISYDFSAIQNVLPFCGNKVDTVWSFFATKDRIKFTEYKGHWPDFAIEKAVVPSFELTDAFRKAIDPLMRRSRVNDLQAQSLANIRDTLLPRLLSGQIKLPNAEEQIEVVSA